ncbi:MAG: hypothetical protein JNK98_04835, partial [Chitinophagaceae bacterium]|nr:hypothetical protein [Chitinophagaceae bacterium]
LEEDDKKPAKKDTAAKTAIRKEDSNTKPIGAPTEEPEKKKGILKRIFGKKEN